ncbi:MAG: tetratricopeptide repeat protein [Chloroflexota bacterium]
MAALNQRLGLTRYEADEYYKRALEAYRKGNFDAAIDAMNYAIELLPTKAEYYAARGFFQYEDGALAEAEADFQRALEHFPYEMLAHYGLGMLAYRNQDWDTALERFMTAYRVDPKRPETLYYLALTYMRRGEPASALNIMAQAQAAFEAANDRRKALAERWMRELGRLAEKTAALLAGRASDNR